MATNALAAKKALRDLVNGLPELNGIQKTYGFPKKEPEKRWCLIGRVRWETSEWHSNRSREERFSIKCALSVQITGALAEEVEDAVLAYAAAIEDAIKANPRLGLAAVVGTSWVPQELTSWPIENGTEAQIDCELEVTARL